ncbi:cyclic di-GMP phosphodiesterase response regulator RpfG [Geobacter sp. OR-1]|uniref:HD-GYP domain-containing protein n=1 Tax=Geobacter sp. OR-1 TaxID=1266765 RepID=UPI0005440964|nr:HD-GYP domain-containing protein [Geobacter sp. OR-1]GAM07947.1 cyclic di-GMP phosphodiesterase response regulator RpfG [Geobacter sp. OR-1]
MQCKILSDNFPTNCMAVLTIGGCLIWLCMPGYLGMQRLEAAGVISVSMLVMYYVLTYLERTARLSQIKKNWELAGEKVHLMESISKLEENYLSTIQSIAAAIDANATYSSGHSARVAGFAVKIGRAMGLCQDELDSLERAALLHDIGTIYIPDHVWRKEGPLTVEEQSLVRQHSVLGAEIIDSVKSLKQESLAIMHHHERYDGTGYPYGLKGLAIPLESRILAVADAFDAMTSERPYRDVLNMRDALEELYSNAGSQFDPRVVEGFLTVLDDITRETEVVTFANKRFGARVYSMVGNC